MKIAIHSYVIDNYAPRELISETLKQKVFLVCFAPENTKKKFLAIDKS